MIIVAANAISRIARASPKTRSRTSPSAIAATASTLSSDMDTSAKVIVQSAEARVRRGAPV